MNSGVGTSGTLGKWSLTGNAAEGRLQFALDGGFPRLYLPAAEICAVIGQGQFPVLEDGLGFGEIGHFWALAYQGTRMGQTRSGKHRWDILSFLHFMPIRLPYRPPAAVQGTNLALNS